MCDLAVSCVDASTGITVIYSDTLHSDAWNLKVLPLSGNEPAALACALSPYRDSEPFVREGMRLCDFSVRYGCPFFPLKMAGMERILSVSFSGGESPAQVAADTLSALTGKNADPALRPAVRRRGYPGEDPGVHGGAYRRDLRETALLERRDGPAKAAVPFCRDVSFFFCGFML